MFCQMVSRALIWAILSKGEIPVDDVVVVVVGGSWFQTEYIVNPSFN